MSKKKKPKTVNIITPGDKKMPVSGMSVKQAINEARKWWNKEGREYARRNRDREEDGIKDDIEIMARSGVQSGRMFDTLDTREKNEVVKSWHHAWCEMELGIGLEDYLRVAGEEMVGVLMKPEDIAQANEGAVTLHSRLGDWDK